MVWASSRAIVSDGPPAENGTMKVITFEGYSAAFPWVPPRKRNAQIIISNVLRTMVYLRIRIVMNNYLFKG